MVDFEGGRHQPKEVGPSCLPLSVGWCSLDSVSGFRLVAPKILHVLLFEAFTVTTDYTVVLGCWVGAGWVLGVFSMGGVRCVSVGRCWVGVVLVVGWVGE